MDKPTAAAMITQAQRAILDVLERMDDVPPLRTLHYPNYLREIIPEVVKGDDGYYITLTVPKRGYGTYKRRGPKKRAIPPEVDVKTLEAVFTLFLPTPFQCVAVRNALENVKIYITNTEANYEQLIITADSSNGSSGIL